MYIARVIGNIVSSEKHPSYDDKKMMLVQKLDLDDKPVGIPTMAIDYLGAGLGDKVLVAAAPGLAQTVFGIPDAPIREIIIGIIDTVSVKK